MEKSLGDGREKSEETDVTPAMIEAGVKALGSSDMLDWRETVIRIWCAMNRAQDLYESPAPQDC